ncbi:MAG: hypothetical protein GTO18_04045 [Anaerolineales bacterium]|nr:hypothetical protein [Anaerolineales bacterium]
MFARNSRPPKAVIKSNLLAGREPDAQAIAGARRLYRKALLLAKIRKLWSFVSRQHQSPIILDDYRNVDSVYRWRYIGVLDIPINWIIGCETQCDEFDSAFYPQRSHDSSRWLTIAIARQMGVPAPPIEVIQIGSNYFAQTGHYQISVARAMGRKILKAYVTSWEINNRIRNSKKRIDLYELQGPS